MIASIEHKGKNFKVDLHAPFDLSIPVSPAGPKAWYVNAPRIAPVLNRFFTGSVKLGGAVNFNEIQFNPHGHGTHTESMGHITNEFVSVNKVLKDFFFMAQIVSVTPQSATEKKEWTEPGDSFISKEQLQKVVAAEGIEAVIVRTLPNGNDKTSRNYSDSNFCYFKEDALQWLAEKNIQHLLVDLPSVDREKDGGLLKAHHAFWKNGSSDRLSCTITEFVFVPDELKDGNYFMNLQLAPFENDAAPSRILVFKLI